MNLGNGITLAGNRAAAVRRAQERLRPYIGGRRLSEELIAERRAEADEER